MRNYTTQMDAARKGIVTPEIEIVAKKENMTTEALMKLVAGGRRFHAPHQDQCKSWCIPRL